MKIPTNNWAHRAKPWRGAVAAGTGNGTHGRVCVVLQDQVDDTNAPKWFHWSRPAIFRHQLNLNMIFYLISRFVFVTSRAVSAGGFADGKATGKRTAFADPMASALHAHVGCLFHSRTQPETSEPVIR